MKKKLKYFVGALALTMALFTITFSAKSKPEKPVKLDGGDREGAIVWSMNRSQN